MNICIYYSNKQLLDIVYDTCISYEVKTLYIVGFDYEIDLQSYRNSLDIQLLENVDQLPLLPVYLLDEQGKKHFRASINLNDDAILIAGSDTPGFQFTADLHARAQDIIAIDTPNRHNLWSVTAIGIVLDRFTRREPRNDHKSDHG